VGLRSLAPGHPDYKAKYYGDLRSREAAYHQGTDWAWLIGPYNHLELRQRSTCSDHSNRIPDGIDQRRHFICDRVGEQGLKSDPLMTAAPVRGAYSGKVL
jgi:hypothetical protein